MTGIQVNTAAAFVLRFMPTLPERFQVSRRTLRFDRLMTRLVTFGGVSVITAVFGIFAFIAYVTWPLFRAPTITSAGQLTLPALAENSALALGENADAVFHYAGGRELLWHQPTGTQSLPLDLPETTQSVSWKLNAVKKRLLIGGGSGEVFAFDLLPPESPQQSPHISKATRTELLTGLPVIALDQAESGSRRLLAALQRDGTAIRLVVTEARHQRDLLGGVQTQTLPSADLSDLLPGFTPVQLLVPGSADSLLLRDAEGHIAYLFRAAGGWEVRQRFHPFDGEVPVMQMALLLGDVTALFTDDQGRLRFFQLHIPEGSPHRVFVRTAEMRPLSGTIEWLAPSPRHKTLLAGNREQLALIHATTGKIRLRLKPDAPIARGFFDARGARLALLDASGALRFHQLEDPHPEAGWRAFFGKVWYEGHGTPKWMWQSTGGGDDYEPKLSLVPLLIGSLKGTLYALLFSIPIALLAAIYSSQFLGMRMRGYVKPVMEIMASLPSVVLGFLAALWLAPLIEDRVPSLLLMTLAMPVTALLAGTLWKHVPPRLRHRAPAGFESWLLAPLLLAALCSAWQFGPLLEKTFFVATLGDGTRVADFRLWWPEATGLPFDQRNSLVVGFMMGFAVIPVIFTIAEDALSNVPASLTSAAEALGASRWQVVRTVVLPVASAGIFSALIIGFGRAIGETMIVVMATGNTPIMDESGRLIFGSHWNLFDGMRTLSANIAVELPEAAQNSTHYRTLFLGALLLFLITFVLNTAAEILRHRLRQKFKVV